MIKTDASRVRIENDQGHTNSQYKGMKNEKLPYKLIINCLGTKYDSQNGIHCDLHLWKGFENYKIGKEVFEIYKIREDDF